MKARYYIMVLLAATIFTACQNGDWDTPDLSTPPYGNNEIVEDADKLITIAELKNRYANAINNSSLEKVTDDLQLKAVINGNDVGGNLYKQICIQDETGALIVGINATGLFPFLPVGQEILIDLKDLYVGGYGQMAQVGDTYNGSIGRMSTATWQQHVKILPTFDPEKIDTLDFDVNMDMSAKAGYLVRIENATIGDAGYPLAPEKSDKYAALTYNGSSNGYVHHAINGLSTSKVVLRTSTYADFAAWVIPQTPVTIYGIATRYRSTWQILIRDTEDIKVNVESEQ